MSISNRTGDADELRRYQARVAVLEQQVRQLQTELEEKSALAAEAARAHRRADEARSAAEEKFRTIVEMAPDAIFIADRHGRLIEVNAAACRQLQCTRAELLRREVSAILPGRLADILSTTLSTDDGSVFVLETCLRADGPEIPVELHICQASLAGDPVFVAVARDISDRKRAEEEFREREVRLRDAEHVAQFGHWTWHVASDTTTWSEELYRIADRDPGQPLPGHAEQERSYTPESWARLKNARQRALTSGDSYDLELETVRPDGAPRYIQAWGAAARNHRGDIERLHGTVQDITERKLAEEELRAAHAELATIHAHAPMVFMVVNHDLIVEKVNDAGARFAGRQKPDLLGLGPGGAIGCLHALEDPQGCGYSPSCGECRIRLAVLDTIHNQARHDNVEAWVPHAEGGINEERCLLVFSAPMATPGRPKALVCALDITGRKRTEEELRDREHWLKESQRVSRIGSYVLNIAAGRWTSSETLDEIFGIGSDFTRSVEGWLTLVDPSQRQEMKEYVENEVIGQRKPFDRVYRIIRPGEDEPRWIHGRGLLLGSVADHSLSLAGTIQDITERKSIEEQLLQARKLESLGRLAGGVAHDFNNLLTVINGYGDLVLRGLRTGDPLRDSVLEIRKAGERAQHLTQQLLAFSRKQVFEPKAMDLNALVTENVDMLQRLVGEDIQVITELEPMPTPVVADSSHLHQVLMNLAVNARDAMAGGGSLTLRTANVDVDEGMAAEGLAAGAYVLLTVSDTGVGIEEEILEHIFDPFFTTKSHGEGTGLGLATVYGIVRQSGGTVFVRSQPNCGATFNIYLPRTKELAAADAEAQAPDGLPLGSETILVVEDLEAVRRFTVAVLRDRGYKVLEAAAGDLALLAAERHHGRIDLLLTDVVMPGMTGKDLAELLKPIRPEMKVLYMSGYSAEVIARRGLLEPGVQYIGKPFSPDALAVKVCDVLGPAQSAAKILVVDDEDAVRHYFQDVLAQAGYEVSVADNGDQALKMVRSQRYQVVLTDLVMPEREGLETIKAMRTEQPHLRIIAVSGAFGGAFLKVASLLGGDVTLAKPVSPDALLAAVLEVLG